ncbi:hypothetical protein HDU76_007702 [Blyttiomyces sp. JEL0837]|nr:hypothetical protein HDU76_007702 [Blyttiomyces sp. JEL0837]
MTHDHQQPEAAAKLPDAVSNEFSKEETNVMDLDGLGIFSFLGDWESYHTIGDLIDVQLLLCSLLFMTIDEQC